MENGSFLLKDTADQMLKRRLWGLASPEVSNGLIAIAFVLLLYVARHIYLSLFFFVNQNFAFGFIYLTVALLYAVPAVGLLQLKSWARIFQLVASLYFVINGVFVIIKGNMLEGALSMILFGLIAIYLLTEKCQLLFKSKKIKIPEEVAM